MKPISKKTYHSLFLAGIIAKALISLGEIISGLAFAFLSYDTLYRIIFAFFGGELMENPRDFIWGYIARGFQDFGNTPQSVWAFIFLSHGIVKIFLLDWTLAQQALGISDIRHHFYLICYLPALSVDHYAFDNSFTHHHP